MEIPIRWNPLKSSMTASVRCAAAKSTGFSGVTGKGLICCTDIAAADFKPPSDQLTRSLLMARIHGRLPDGTIIDGVEVFRQLYARIGLAWLVAITRWPLVRPILDIGYNWFARNRGRLTGRCHEDACSSGS